MNESTKFYISEYFTAIKSKSLTMSKIILKVLSLTALLSAGMLLGCANKEMEEKIRQLEKEKAQIEAESNEKQRQIDDILAAMSEIQESLNAVRETQAVVARTASDMEARKNSQDMKARIINGIQDIESAMAENRRKMEELQQKLKGYQGKIKSLERMAKSLQETIAQKDREIAMLKEEIARLNIQVATLTSSVQEKEGIIQEQERILQSAYYIVDTENNLKEKGILEYKGGIIGIGSTITTTQDFDVSQFKKIDINEVREFSIPRNIHQIRVLTTHSTSSYELSAVTEKESVLRIKDPKIFWEKSKFLVVMMWN
ncbi:MAG: hypothetical protein D0433_05025 [Candidatus Thermochlorobacter aerophilum]|uniref:Uncharacterized protein n=1 Tax=Candidatus Thermochlorobacter aerophilus TaxID=1868324 RepID=A0A395M0R8_9BACT|nr:MAG: hypothetical protein D0433_05025 [Candidatus Thermochlorobacter aerophilum]